MLKLPLSGKGRQMLVVDICRTFWHRHMQFRYESSSKLGTGNKISAYTISQVSIGNRIKQEEACANDVCPAIGAGYPIHQIIHVSDTQVTTLFFKPSVAATLK